MTAAAKSPTERFEIVVSQSDPRSDFHGTRSDTWSNDGVGDGNEFDSEDAAREGIEALRKLGDDWADATYDVRRIGDRYPL